MLLWDFDALGRTLAGARFWAIGGLLLLMTLLRNGIYVSWNKGILLEASQSFPHGKGWIYESWAYLAVPRLFGISSLGAWALYHLALTAAFFGGIFVTARSMSRDGRLLFVASVFTSSLPTILFYNVGWYDVLMLLGAVVVAAGRRPASAVVGTLVMSGGNPVQTVVAGIALTLTSAGGRWKVLGRRSLIVLGTASVGYVGTAIWVQVASIESRGDLLRENVLPSIHAFVDGMPVAIFAWYGGAWLVVAALILGPYDGWSRLLSLTGLVVVPAVASILTLDGTRVFASIAALPFLVALTQHFREDRRPVPAWAGLMVVLLLAVPGIYFRGDTRSVWL